MSDYLNRQRQGYDANSVLIASSDATADEVGSAIDIGENVELDITSIYRGALGNADNTAAVVIQESDDEAFTTPVTLVNMTTLTNAITSDSKMARTTKRWVRASTTTVGTTKSIGGFEVYINS